MSVYAPRYPGIRWKIVYGCYDGIQQFAVAELQRIVQSYVPYVVEIIAADEYQPSGEENCLAVGTAANNSLIQRGQTHGWLKIPTQPESFAYRCGDSPFPPLKRLAFIAGADAKGVLNGVADFGASVISRQCVPLTDTCRQEALDRLTPLAYEEIPVIENRGIWTWGYVIYDYRSFIDQMARLKMNMLTIWNDCAPLNLREVVNYAHRRGIRLVCGYHWGWGVDGLSLSSRSDCEKVRDQVLAHYEKQYLPCGVDGIYFQTLTEHPNTTEGGKTIAALVCDWVNLIGRAFLQRYPDLYIQFGLHATSILDHYPDLLPLDPRIPIVWEDAGVMPYSYFPTLEHPADSHYSKHGLGNFEGTLAYSKKISAFRGKTEFGLCPKGYSNLDWGNEFEHHGPFLLGERSARFIRRKADEKSAWNHFINSTWPVCAEAQARFYREIRQAAPGPITSIALVEEGLLEAAIQPAVALFAETVWNPHRPLKELSQRAQSPYYQGL
jgi:hypothetical protein